MTEQWISVQEAAAHLGVDPKTIRRYIAAGLIRAERIGPRLIRIDRKGLDRVGKPMQPQPRIPLGIGNRVARDPLVEVRDYITDILTLKDGESKTGLPTLAPDAAAAVAAFLGSYAGAVAPTPDRD